MCIDIEYYIIMEIGSNFRTISGSLSIRPDQVHDLKAEARW